MPQLHLPLFPKGSTAITSSLVFAREDERITYYHCTLPVFSHKEDDLATFRMITSQFIESGQVKQAQIARAFGIPLITVKRSVKKYREEGAGGFYAERRTRGAAVLTQAVLSNVQQLLDEGRTVTEVAARLGLKKNTLDKAVRADRLRVVKKQDPAAGISSKSERTSLDASALMGVAAHNVIGRLAASIGGCGAAPPQFIAALDVPNGGVLCALPALLAMGLLEGTEKYFTLPAGYYAPDSLLMLIAFMTLLRMETLEALRGSAPGEWGKLLGLDRAPEIRTLREKVHAMSHDGKPYEWSASLCQRWIEKGQNQANVLCIDAHVRVYHGSQTALPKHYIAREKLCQRATADYWVNAMDGQPFMVVNQVVDPGLIRSVEEEILPALEARHPALAKPVQELAPVEVTNVTHVSIEGEVLPTVKPAVKAPRTPHCLTLVFDREAYSPGFFKRMQSKHIACLTYNKYPDPPWPEEEFQMYSVQLVSGQVVPMRLAERGIRLSNGLWLREIRKLTDRGHQTPIISTDYHTTMEILAPRMFARWSQENFFRYARMHFGLDRLADYSTEEITDPIQVVNPAYRKLDGEVRSANGKLSRMLAQFGALNIEAAIDPEQMEPFLAQKATLHEQIESLKTDIAKLKADRKTTERRIEIKDLPEADRFRKLATQSKHFLDTIKMIAYRSECAVANIVRESMPKQDQARALLSALYATEADILPDPVNKTLTIRLHHGARAHTDAVIAKLCDELTSTETVFPRTDLRMIFTLGSSQNR